MMHSYNNYYVSATNVVDPKFSSPLDKQNERQSEDCKKIYICWKLPDGAQSFVFSWQIVMEYINWTFFLVNTIKMRGILLNVVHFRVHKNISSKESDRCHNHSNLKYR